jgi:tetratricopeptide (TPR) repeat protein
MKRHGETVLWADRALRFREAPWLWYVKGAAHLGLRESTLAMKAFEHALALDPNSKEARAGLRKAKTLHETTDFYRGVYECFGTLLVGDPGCEECEIRAHCREVSG